ncbi:DUF5817 domain-containing protein [Natronoarchaeum mannanilyticum]|uniref:DUF5817 domain-containing protein n=1 Tax=Natronoarchaeum mannanilyticum TaxID=926360 RepID=A0AAV3T9S9_9EURY
MYAVVGCTDCSALWLVEGRQQTAQCQRCGKTHQFEKLKKFVETDDEDHAREVRASMLANRQDHGEAFAEVDSFAELESQVDDAVVDDAEYLEGSGIDPDAVDEAADRAMERSAGGGQSRKETVLDALRALEEPTEDDVIAYAVDRGVPAEYVRKSLDKLAQRGRVSENRGVYRLL